MRWRDDLEIPFARTVLLAPLTTLGIGGPAEVCAPRDLRELQQAITWCAATRTKWRVLGRGSNLLVSDEGVKGVVILTRALNSLRFGEDGEVVAGAGVRTSVLLGRARERGLGGLESLVGFPATVGGVARMNAGGRWGYAGERIEKVRVVGANGTVRELTAAECAFGYRTSALAACVLAEVVFRLPRIDSKYVDRTMAIQREKSRSQPLTKKSAGCVFKNPAGESAGRVIDLCGMKGLRVGGAVVSHRHANFILNEGRATSADVTELIERVRDGVEDRAGVRLELEVEVWN